MSTKSAFVSNTLRLLIGAAAIATALIAPNTMANASSSGGCGETTYGITVCITDEDNWIHAWTLIQPEQPNKTDTRIELCRVEDSICVVRATGTERGAEVFATALAPGDYFAAYYHGMKFKSAPLTWP